MRTEMCLLQVALYVLILCSFVHCIFKPKKRAKVSIEYTDGEQHVIRDEYFHKIYYGQQSRANASPVKGQLVLVNTLTNITDTNDSSSELGRGPLDSSIVSESLPWIALIKRGQCTFNEKIYFAAKLSNAVAVIIYDSEYSIISREMITGGKYNVEDVVAVMVSYEDGKQLVNTLRAYANVNATITEWRYTWEKQIELLLSKNDSMASDANKSSILHEQVISIVLFVLYLLNYNIQDI